MGNISYTAHVSNKKSAITSKSKLAAVAKHNLRKYKSSDYSKDNICIIYGTSNLIDDVKTVYHKEFDEALEEYNKKQIRPDRKIEDYFEHVAGKGQDMAVEIIIQIGDREFWKQFDDMKSYMKLSYQIILDELRKRLPQFVVANAVVHLGYPYVWGGSSPSTSFDCSGFVCWVFTNSGVHNLPRTTAQGIYDQCTPVSAADAKAGDIIFFTGTYNSPGSVSHVGIYCGNGIMIHCGDPIKYASINTPYWQSHFYSFGRLN